MIAASIDSEDDDDEDTDEDTDEDNRGTENDPSSSCSFNFHSSVPILSRAVAIGEDDREDEKCTIVSNSFPMAPLEQVARLSMWMVSLLP